MAPHGERCVVYTGDLNFILLRKVGLTPKEASVAGKAIDLIIEGSHERRNSQSAHYRTRAELEAVSGEGTIQRLIDTSVIELHRKWWPALRIERTEVDSVGNVLRVLDRAVHKRHPQAMYRINPRQLHSLMHPEEF